MARAARGSAKYRRDRWRARLYGVSQLVLLKVYLVHRRRKLTINARETNYLSFSRGAILLSPRG